MSQLGGAERKVSASGTYVAWVSDLKSVLIRDREGNAGPFSIYQVLLDTLERRQLTHAPVGAGDWRFDVSPDGRTLAFIRYEREGIADLYVVPMPGGEPRRLTNWSRALTGLSWTPDGRDIVYSVEDWSAGRLWRIHASSAGPGRGSPIADIPVSAVESGDLEASCRATGATGLSDDHIRRRPLSDGPPRRRGERHYRIEAVCEFDAHRGFRADLAGRRTDCVCVVPVRRTGDLGRRTGWKWTSTAHLS